MTELLFKDECYQIVGACFEVYNEKDVGFLNRFIKSASKSNSSIWVFRLKVKKN